MGLSSRRSSSSLESRSTGIGSGGVLARVGPPVPASNFPNSVASSGRLFARSDNDLRRSRRASRVWPDGCANLAKIDEILLRHSSRVVHPERSYCINRLGNSGLACKKNRNKSQSIFVP